MKIYKWLITLAVFAGCFFCLQRLFIPKYASGQYEGNLIREYYGEAKDHDVLIIGDCEVYENISPVTLWEEYGITSFIRGSAQQLMWQSYYLLEEALRYEKPKVVVFSILAMQYDTPQYEPYNRLTLDDMKVSDLKYKAVAASRMEGEDWLSYALPLLRYHDRWSELSGEDFKYFFNKPKVSVNGFMIRTDVKPIAPEDVPEGMKKPDYRFGENSYFYLDKMTQLCADNGVALVLIKAPSLYPYWYPQWDEQMKDYAEKNNLLYINFLDYIDEIGLDFGTDTYDAGLHLNVFGAEKLAVYFGKILQNEFQLENRQDEPETAARWAEKSRIYESMKAAQINDLAEYGKVQTFLIN